MADINIGITYFVRENGSIFGSSRGQTALMLRKVLQACNYNVTLVHCGTEVKWWDDAGGLEGQTISLMDCSGLDLLIDIDATLSGEIRKKIAKRVIGFLRGRVLFNELEHASYLQQNIVRIMDGLDEIWFWDVFNPEEDLGPLGSLLKIPLRSVPFVWESFILDNYLKLSGITKNLAKTNKYIFHIAEKNNSNTSSAIIPLCGLVELNKTYSVDKVKVHNGIELEKNPFFNTNILPNLQLTNIEYTGRERFADWCYHNNEDNPFVITHCRYVPFRYSMLDLAYLGIPFAHNSKLLNRLGVNGYYNDNSISGIASVVKDIINKLDISGLEIPDFSIWSTEHQKDKWLAMDLFLGSLVKPISEILAKPEMPDIQKKQIRIGFANMWEGFNSSSNFFVDLLNYHGYKTEGVSNLENIDLLIFGPFGQIIPDIKCPKVFFTGENINNPTSADLYLTFNPVEDETHIRLPLWMLFLNWFSKEIDKTQNPQTLPVELATQQHPVGFEDREDFSFVVSNPSNELRNDVFLKLIENYKINSGGALYNNIGGPLYSRYGGGGAGDIIKHEFLEKHKFNICFENSKGEGYVTEKLLHAKLAGCVPIYWGAPEAAKDFNPEGFIDVSECNSVDKVVEKISGILAFPDKLKQMAMTPALDAQRFLAAKDKLFFVASKLASLAISQNSGVYLKPESQNHVPLFISYVTSKYVESAIINIKSVHNINPQISYRIYLGPDVTEEERKKLLVYDTVNIVEMETYYKPSSFGWKLDILHKVVNEPGLKNKMIIYTDAGAQWINLPEDLLNKAYNEGMYFLLDPDNNTNYQWCSKEMQEEYKLTKEELEARQILAGFQIFRGGHNLPVKVFNEAFIAGANPKILEGEKYIGFINNGQYDILHGHRHDQSILSTLRIRYNVPSISASGIVNEKSLKLTKLSKCSIYLHRADYKEHIYPLPKVDDIWIINLDRRTDRLEDLYMHYPFLKQYANRFSAVDGKELQITPSISKLIEGNDFINKKSVTAVALSHIMLWAQLVADDSVNSYLILEDDVRFNLLEWQKEWNKISEKIPEDAELLYLGGILPGNKAAYKECINAINDVWATIKPNEYFTPGRPTNTFHFCAYSYIITKSGAKKLLEVLEQVGCFTSIDHFLGHPMFGLKKYVLNNLLTTCFQENDPDYIKAEFDNFKRIDTFDSDIWNNVDCWSEEEIKNKLKIRPSVKRVVEDILNQVSSNPITKSLLKQNLPLKNLYYKVGYDKTILDKLNKIGLYFNLVEFNDIIVVADPEPLFLVHDITVWQETLNKYTSADIHFNVLCTFKTIKYTYITHELLDNILKIKEVLDKDSIPFYVRSKDDEEYWGLLKTCFNFVELTTEVAKEKLILYFKKNPTAEITYRNGLKNNMKKFINKLHIMLYR